MVCTAVGQHDAARPHDNDNSDKCGMEKSSQRSLGQYFTTHSHWLNSLVIDFIGGDYKRVIDPFAGGGDLLKHFPTTKGYDIDSSLGWSLNDSLIGIPRGGPSDICITNPPYLAKKAATRLKLGTGHFGAFDDLYEVGIDQCLRAFGKVVAIIPESSIGSTRFKDRLAFVNIVEQPLFGDTDCPVLVAGWDRQPSPDFRVYKNSMLVGWWQEITSAVPEASNDHLQ